MLLRVYSKMDDNNKIAIPNSIRRGLNVKPGETLELKIVGIKNARRLLISKRRGP